MKALHKWIRSNILAFIDLFYPLVDKIMPLTTFRYAACGGINTAFSIFLYFIGYNYIYHKENVHFIFITLSPHIAADYLFAIWISFPIGFYLSRYVVFQESTLRRRVQLFRYFIVVVGSMLLNYACLKFFVEVMRIYPTPSKIITTFFVVVFSYFSQRNFSFKA